jgi:hypothetical protein
MIVEYLTIVTNVTVQHGEPQLHLFCVPGMYVTESKTQTFSWSCKLRHSQEPIQRSVCQGQWRTTSKLIQKNLDEYSCTSDGRQPELLLLTRASETPLHPHSAASRSTPIAWPSPGRSSSHATRAACSHHPHKRCHGNPSAALRHTHPQTRH